MNKYSETLKVKCKELYPTTNKINELALNNAYILGRWLDDNSPDYIKLNELLDCKTIDEVKEKAMLAKRKVDLYKLWMSEVQGWM